MKFWFLFVVVLFCGFVAAQEPAEVVSAISKAVCVGVADNGSCIVPQPLNQKISGVCCGGQCVFDASECGKGMGYVTQYGVYEMFQRLTCRNASEGDECSIPEAVNKALGRKMRGSCCSGLCRVGIESCGNYCGDGYCTSMEREDGNCMEDCGKQNGSITAGGGGKPSSEDNTPESTAPQKLEDNMLFVIAGILGVAVVVFIMAILIRSKKEIIVVEKEKPKSVRELLREKEEIEKMIDMARSKYHKRELDEESFREIIRDNQKKVIELELRIKTYRQ
ncbi:MAG: hypothetical protein NTU61_04715 [Candidatus Altiarchaeota archaeon]|nr:hypothetical protein [Candidatus Altiarchaeota archaeon]